MRYVASEPRGPSYPLTGNPQPLGTACVQRGSPGHGKSERGDGGEQTDSGVVQFRTFWRVIESEDDPVLLRISPPRLPTFRVHFGSQAVQAIEALCPRW